MKIAHNCQVKDLVSIYEKYFSKPGILVDVGAYNGYDFSNTWGLVEAGWTGVLIDPIQENIESCQRVHRDNKVSTLCVAIGDKNGTAPVFLGGSVTTLSDAQRNNLYWKNEYTGESRKVPVYTLNHTLEHLKFPIGFELLSIDVEGFEKEVLKGFDLNHWKPGMVIIEAQELHPEPSLRINAKFINDYFSFYKKIYCDEINNIYVREDGNLSL
jgi:FkbM family methyltransferase